MILCGTDLSVASEPALKTAAALAKKQGRELLLVTVLERDDPKARMDAELRLERDAGELRRDFALKVETSVAAGAPDLELLAMAKRRSASLLVVGAEGRSRRGRRVGSVPEHLCQTSSIPVLVARNADSLRSWSRDAQPLRVLVGSGLGDASASALRAVSDWPDLALTVAHVAWPYGEHYRLGVSAPMPLDHLRPEVHHQLMGDLGRWASRVPCRNSANLCVIAGWGRIDSHLAQLADEKGADLLVVGCHQRNLSQRVWQGSVSRSALHEASCNVLCVPQRALPARVAGGPKVIVVPTDFSALSDRAVAVGYSLLERGGTLQLVHVTNNPSEPERAACLEQLEARIPEDADSRGIASELRVLEGPQPWLAIWQQASRASADMICLATHSREGLAEIVLGSQAQSLLRHCRIPVVLVPPDREG
jgi:nucleotide-binding universal stress UspA family protein